MSGVVARSACLGAAVVLLSGAGTVSGLAQPSAAPPSAQPLRVITDTREYCDKLVSLADALKRPPAHPQVEALALANEGERMCRNGHVRAGIARLRRAIVLLRATDRRE